MDLTGRVQIHPSPRRLSFSELLSSVAALVSRFNPDDYADNTDVPMLVAKLEHAARALNASDLVPDLH
jgi:DnaJ-domain-containing protein 1